MPLYRGFKLDEATINQLQAAYAANQLTTTQVLRCYLNRILQINKWLNSIHEGNPDALAIATRLDKDRKAAMTERAHMRSSGQVRSPYNITVSPGGSSSGSAAAVAANQCIFSLGTETDGSVVIPAGRNAFVGIKPTVGVTSRNGVIPEARHLDTVGFLQEQDSFTSAQKGKTLRGGYSQSVTGRKSLQGARFGIPWDSFWKHNSPEQADELMQILYHLRLGGATIVNNTELENHNSLVNPHGWDWDWRGKMGFPNESDYTLVKVDFYNDIKAYLSELGNNPIRSVEDIIQYNLDSNGTEGGLPGVQPGFLGGQERFHESAASKGLEDEEYHAALSFTQSTARIGIDRALTRGKTPLDALLVPTDFQQAASVAAQAGYPLITTPAGVNGTRTSMPYGLMLMGTAWNEHNLIRWASAIEDSLRTPTGVRPLPEWKDHRRRILPIIYE
ncbi:amidase family protein [Xylariaceae sp. FL1272]|nr:amidase family protein [Xylariaceae sp. FL1272]